MENIIIIVVILIFIGFIDWNRAKAEKERLQQFIESIKVVQPKEVVEPIYEPIEKIVQDEIIELDEVEPEQLIKELNGNYKG